VLQHMRCAALARSMKPPLCHAASCCTYLSGGSLVCQLVDSGMGHAKPVADLMQQVVVLGVAAHDKEEGRPAPTGPCCVAWVDKLRQRRQHLQHKGPTTICLRWHCTPKVHAQVNTTFALACKMGRRGS
jgi:hypothetical protein